MTHTSLLVRFLTLLFCAAILTGLGAEELSVLPSPGERPRTGEMMRSYLRGLAGQALDRRLRRYESLQTSGQISRYQAELKRRFVEHLGGFPERTPLNARVVGASDHGAYRLERIIFESRPGFPVTANLYLPLGEPPYPAVLLSAGHLSAGKIGYQNVALALVANGLAVLAYDPIGQGERKLFPGEPESRLNSPTTGHMIASVAPILLGRNLAAYMIWDGIRAIDYLVSRPEIDAARIGCTGNSGGGMMTSYLMALDDRVASAAPGCFITTTRRKNESPGPGDAEQNIHAQIEFGLDHADYLLLRAPRPTLILSATRDYVPIAGAWDSFRQAKRIYTRLGYPERVDMVETDRAHGFSEELRQGAIRWMRRWLLRTDDTATEKELPLLPEQELLCTPEGRVSRLPGSRSVFDLNVEEERELAAARDRLWREAEPAELLARVRKIAGVRPLSALPRARVETVGRLEREGYGIEKLVLRSEPGIELPALRFVPANPGGGRYLYLHGEGKHADAAPGGPIEKLVRDGHTVLSIDLRASGETRTTPWRYQGVLDFMGDNVAEFFIAYMLGKSFVGMRAEDILTAARALSDESPAGDAPIRVIAVGEAGPPALHAVALEPGLFEALTLRRSLTSWSDAVHTPVTRGVLINVVHGALRTYDLPNLVTAIGAGRVTIEEPVNAAGQSADAPPD